MQEGPVDLFGDDEDHAFDEEVEDLIGEESASIPAEDTADIVNLNNHVDQSLPRLVADDLFGPTQNIAASRPLRQGPLRPGGLPIRLSDLTDYQTPSQIIGFPEPEDYWPDNFHDLAFACEYLGLHRLKQPVGGQFKKAPTFTLKSALDTIVADYGDVNELMSFESRSHQSDSRFLELNNTKVPPIFYLGCSLDLFANRFLRVSKCTVVLQDS